MIGYFLYHEEPTKYSSQSTYKSDKINNGISYDGKLFSIIHINSLLSIHINSLQ